MRRKAFPRPAAGRRSRLRSEEHTSELQSLAYLVCRLLLEKKKNRHVRTSSRTHEFFQYPTLRIRSSILLSDFDSSELATSHSASNDCRTPDGPAPRTTPRL